MGIHYDESFSGNNFVRCGWAVGYSGCASGWCRVGSTRSRSTLVDKSVLV